MGYVIRIIGPTYVLLPLMGHCDLLSRFTVEKYQDGTQGFQEPTFAKTFLRTSNDICPSNWYKSTQILHRHSRNLKKNVFRLFHFFQNDTFPINHVGSSAAAYRNNFSTKCNERLLDTKVELKWTITSASKLALKLRKKRFFAKKTFFPKIERALTMVIMGTRLCACALLKVQTIRYEAFERLLTKEEWIRSSTRSKFGVIFEKK